MFIDFQVSTTKQKTELPHDDDSRYFLPSRFGRQLAGYLNLNMDNGPWLAGGAVRKSYLNMELGQSDWDIWFRDAKQFAQAESALIALGADPVFKSDNAITFKLFRNDICHTIQIICKRYFDNAEQVMSGFDFTICQMVTDGRSVIMGPHTVQDLQTHTLRLAQIQIPRFIIPRMVKYIVYGYNPCAELVNQIKQDIDNIDWKEQLNDYQTI